MKSQPKTNRKRGVIYNAIRKVAKEHPTFTRMDLGLERVQAVRSCIELVRQGELRIVTPAKHQPAVYTRTSKLSPVTPRKGGGKGR